jgi:hypothetical protein
MVLRYPKIKKNLKDLGHANVGALTRKVGICGQILKETLLFSGVENSLMKFVQSFSVHSVYQVQGIFVTQATLTKPSNRGVGSSDTN